MNRLGILTLLLSGCTPPSIPDRAPAGSYQVQTRQLDYFCTGTEPPFELLTESAVVTDRGVGYRMVTDGACEILYGDDLVALPDQKCLMETESFLVEARPLYSVLRMVGDSLVEDAAYQYDLTDRNGQNTQCEIVTSHAMIRRQ